MRNNVSHWDPYKCNFLFIPLYFSPTLVSYPFFHLPTLPSPPHFCLGAPNSYCITLDCPSTTLRMPSLHFSHPKSHSGFPNGEESPGCAEDMGIGELIFECQPSSKLYKGPPRQVLLSSSCRWRRETVTRRAEAELDSQPRPSAPHPTGCFNNSRALTTPPWKGCFWKWQDLRLSPPFPNTSRVCEGFPLRFEAWFYSPRMWLSERGWSPPPRPYFHWHFFSSVRLVSTLLLGGHTRFSQS